MLKIIYLCTGNNALIPISHIQANVWAADKLALARKCVGGQYLHKT